MTLRPQAFVLWTAFGVGAWYCIGASAQAPWQVPAAYWSPPTQVQYQAYWPATAMSCGAPSCSTSPAGGCQASASDKPACGDCCCCCKPNGSQDPSGPDPPEDPPEDPPRKGGPDGEPDDENDGLASYAIRRVRNTHRYSKSDAAITGEWRSKFGPVSLHQEGNVVSGNSQYNQGGIIDMQGRYDLGVLTLSFQHRSRPTIRGKVAFHYDRTNGQLVGKSRNSVSGQEANWLLYR